MAEGGAVLYGAAQRAVIYTDGGCRKDGIGAWAFAVTEFGKPPKHHHSGHVAGTTNNRMELTAVIEALKYAAKDTPLMIVSDSEVVVKGATTWHQRWIANGWISSGNKPVKNRDLWEELLTLAAQHDVHTKLLQCGSRRRRTVRPDGNSHRIRQPCDHVARYAELRRGAAPEQIRRRRRHHDHVGGEPRD